MWFQEWYIVWRALTLKSGRCWDVTELLSRISVGAAKAKVVIAGSLAWVLRALGLIDDAGTVHARSYEHTTLAVLGPEQTTTDAFEQWPWSEGPAYAWGIGDFSSGDWVVCGHDRF